MGGVKSRDLRSLREPAGGELGSVSFKQEVFEGSYGLRLAAAGTD